MAIALSLWERASVGAAITDLGFVQYDPIRAPARAQDLILGQRVPGYRAGDLDQAYESLGLEEDHFHVYGAMTREVLALLHPRCDERGEPAPHTLSSLEEAVLAAVKQRGRLDSHGARTLLGNEPAVNEWGGISAASTRALEALHRHGLLRVASRRNGVKAYEVAALQPSPLSPEERLRKVTLLLAHLLSPVPEQSLRQALTQLRMHSRGVPNRPAVIADLRRSGELTARAVHGVTYLWPGTLDEPVDPVPEPESRVRFLAPFDPLVWDRRRLAHLWGWDYRFEAYTPAAKRRFGYYAMPMFWRDEAVGWVNCLPDESGSLAVTPGFIQAQPRDRQFRSAFEEELQRLQSITGTHVSVGQARL